MEDAFESNIHIVAPFELYQKSVKINFIVILMKVLSAFQFVIVGTFGETPQTDIAVDAVCVMPCEGEKMSRGHKT